MHYFLRKIINKFRKEFNLKGWAIDIILNSNIETSHSLSKKNKEIIIYINSNTDLDLIETVSKVKEQFYLIKEKLHAI